ncbi:SSI family serine proteinase inhibitor [Actinoplanes siamensis]|uniref:Subtilase-type protease inhibitor n=1 Tax=Actinoplanes siamensis TaxID=1223317 RepID=A0A919TKK1_9ACTN|nr:SSI family serine proteinase inhibitor [Actinoplanes siamensis]GIF05245.1 subtilase-type protease inhibitor [Actinoplanes siamensis]
MYSIRRAGVLALSLCAATATLAAGSPAQAAPTPAPASSGRVVLSVFPAEVGDETPRVAVLRCDVDGGTHRLAKTACDELRAVDGDVAALADDEAICTREYRPVTAVAVGVWRGEPLTYRATFSNRCILLSATGNVFNF